MHRSSLGSVPTFPRWSVTPACSPSRTPSCALELPAAVAISWIDGESLPEGIGDPAAFGLLLEALREMGISPEL